MQHTPTSRAPDSIAPAPRGLERLTGGLLIIYGLLVLATVTTRIGSQSDQADFFQTAMMIATNRDLYLASAVINLISNVLLLALAALLYLTLSRREPALLLVGTCVLVASASVWVVSSAAGLALLSIIDSHSGEGTVPLQAMAASGPTIELIREVTGKASFTLAALALLAIGAAISWRGMVPRWLGWLAVATGLLMLFIWSDDAALLHRVGGAGYLLWLWLLGGWLLLKGTHPPADS